ncbi:hypothetical protein CLIB1423_13S03290 [[Candida] railenensis]|uniref:L-2-hydroxyglutarate dehydrogenase, mitochondrial n=1 Tax=[Candida] railenensis TaxID=45579 RepID=A0A9P0VYP1_9ASCO|nr:hypothetical protein CLIB1423_13S03290 [[Candida] railenensis]
MIRSRTNWLKYGQLSRSFSSSRYLFSDFSHVIIGGGVVGTAIASEIQGSLSSNVLIVEQHEKLGMETTARNSEVIHAGLYYPKDSLKGQLCIKGKNMIYDAYNSGKFDSVQVPLAKCGKWVVAQTEEELEYLHKLHKHAEDVGVPVELISSKQAKQLQPNINASYGALVSPTTGIISAHDLTLYFETQFENSGGTVSLNTKLEAIEYDKSSGTYRLQLKDVGEDSSFEITADNVVNSAGLYAPKVSNLLLPTERHYESHFAKGSYFGYSPTDDTKTKVSDVLIYPCPNPNASSLGVHLTFDLGGQFRFGPDLEWLEDVENAEEINYDVSVTNLQTAFKEIQRYFPGITESSLQPSYSGVRPKLLSAAENKKNFADFIIKEEEGFPGFVNLLGIESPGLTSSWAIAEYVKNIYEK